MGGHAALGEQPPGPNTGSMLGQHRSPLLHGSMPVNRIRPWPNIETDLGDCPVFTLTAIRVTLYAPKGHYLDNTIHWPNCEILLNHRLRRWANIIPIKTLLALNHEYNSEFICFFLKIF